MTEKPRYTLIGSPNNRAFRVLWALEEMSLPYHLEVAKPHSDVIRALNPAGKVPALIDNAVGEQAIFDSVAITQYLADTHQQLTFGAGTLERAQQDSFTQFACDELDGSLWALAKHTFVWPEEMRALDAVKPGLQRDFKRAINTLENRLGDNPFVMGELFTVPDIIITHCAGWASRVGLEINSAAVNAYIERVTARPAYLRAHALREA